MVRMWYINSKRIFEQNSKSKFCAVFKAVKLYFTVSGTSKQHATVVD